jgi:hypothetical protein
MSAIRFVQVAALVIVIAMLALLILGFLPPQHYLNHG